MGPNSSNLQTVLSQGWLYRGEGNANLVLSLPKTHQILRIHKTTKPTTMLQWLIEWLMQILAWDQKRLFKQEIKNLEFYNCIMIPLLGEAYVHPATNINTEKKEIRKLDEELLSFRPAHRRNKHLQYGIATLFRDYAFLSEKWDLLEFTSSTYSVEIKPKQGWVPVTDRYFNKCQFCLNQHLKLKGGKIKEISSYCPLDLFSGEKASMTRALKSLIFNPQNNFKIFKDGIYIYGENSPIQSFYEILNGCFQQLDSINKLTDTFCNLMVQALLKESNNETKGCVNCDSNSAIPHNYNNKENRHINQIKLNKCAFNAAKLPAECVLNKILSLQKLNVLGLNKYCDVYEALNKKDIKFDDWKYVCKFLQDVKLKSATSCLKCVVADYVKYTDNYNKKELWNELDLVPYLLAALANDCSFMITFRRIKKFQDVPKDILIEIDNWNFLVNIGIFDLYPKPASTILKHKERSMKIQNAYTF